MIRLGSYFMISDDGLDLNMDEIFTIPEFEELYALERNKSESDPTGENRERFKKEIRYIYVKYDTNSYAFEHNEKDKEEAALSDSGLTQEELEDPTFKAALERFLKENRDPDEELLSSAINLCYRTKDYFDRVDYTLRDPDKGFPLYNAKDVMMVLKSLSGMIDGLEDHRDRIRKKKEDEVVTRGDVEVGHFD